MLTPSLVGVSNQLAWLFIGIASIRFRRALKLQGKTHLLPFKNWTYPWGPWIAIVLNAVIILVQGWSCFSPTFAAVDFVSYYVEIPIMFVMYLGWKIIKKTRWVHLEEMDLETDVYTVADEEEEPEKHGARKWFSKVLPWLF